MPCRQRRTGGRAGFGTYNHDTLCVISALVSCGWWAAPAGARLFFRCIFSGGRPDSIKRIFSPSRDLQQATSLIAAAERRDHAMLAHLGLPLRRPLYLPVDDLVDSIIRRFAFLGGALGHFCSPYRPVAIGTVIGVVGTARK